MQCPKCANLDTKVLDTRLGKNRLSIRRRRECLECHYRFTTVEEVLRDGVVVIKRDGGREEFDRSKMLSGIRKAIEKRPIQGEQIEIMIAEIMDVLERDYDVEIPSDAIGEHIMDHLKDIDKISYVRFASVYKDFRDFDELVSEVDNLKEKPLQA